MEAYVFCWLFFFFWHAQIKISLPLSLLGNSARFLNSLLSVCVITLLPVSSAADVEGWGFLTLKQPISSLYFILIGSIFLDRRKGCCHITVHWLFAQRRCPHGMKPSTDFFPLFSLCIVVYGPHTYTCKYIGTEHNTLICWWQSLWTALCLWSNKSSDDCVCWAAVASPLQAGTAKQCGHFDVVDQKWKNLVAISDKEQVTPIFLFVVYSFITFSSCLKSF